jgi:hypothetical protein
LLTRQKRSVTAVSDSVEQIRSDFTQKFNLVFEEVSRMRDTQHSIGRLEEEKAEITRLYDSAYFLVVEDFLVVS